MVLPSSFLGGPRDMHQRFQYAMAIVQRSGKLDYFLTMTCNPKWPDIKEQLLLGQTHHDRPDLTTRVFCAKYGDLKKYILHKNTLGCQLAHIVVTEFQNRGLPNVHMLLIMHSEEKPACPKTMMALSVRNPLLRIPHLSFMGQWQRALSMALSMLSIREQTAWWTENVPKVFKRTFLNIRKMGKIRILSQRWQDD